MGNLFEVVAKIMLDTDGYEKGLDDASKTTSSFGQKLKNGLGAAAKVGAAAVTAVATATTAMSTAMLKGVADTAAYGDNIDKMSQKMGLSAEAYQEWDAIMQHSGTSIESLQAGMKTLANAVENNNEAFGRLGISQEQIASMNNEELFSATITALQNVENETERTYLAGQLLGRGATELGALLNTSAEDTEKMRQRVHELGGVMSDDAVKAAAKYQDSLQDMKTAFSGISRGLLSEFLPSVTSVMDGLTEIFAGNDESGINQITEGINGIIENITNAAPRFLEIGSQILSSIANAIIENLPSLMQTGLSIITSLIQGITENIPKLVDPAIQVLNELSNFFIENLPTIIDAALQIVVSLADGITQALPELIPAAVDGIITIVDTLIDNVDQLVDAAIEIIMALADGLIEALPKLIEKAPEIVVKLVEAIVRNAPKLLEAAAELIGKLAFGIIESLPEIGKAAGEIISTIVKGISDLIGKIKDVGKNIVKGLWEGITGMGDWIKDKVGGFFDGVVGGVKDLLGIHSPSRLFAGIGENMALGLGEGWDKSFDKVAGDIQDGLDFSGDLAYNTYRNGSAGNGFNGYGQGTQVVQNIYSQAKTAADLMEEARWNFDMAVAF